MTESEAKTKLCPILIIAAPNTPPHTCIGSDCAMWRAIRIPQDYPTYKVTFDGEHISSQQVDIVNYGGYCGLAGKP